MLTCLDYNDAFTIAALQSLWNKLDRHQNPLGPNFARFCDRARDDVACDSMDGLAAGFPTATWFRLVRACRCSNLCSSGLLLVVVPFRRLCTADFLGRRGDRRFRW